MAAGALVVAACSGGDPELAPSTTVDFTAVSVTTEPPSVPLTLPEVEEPRIRQGTVRVGIWLEADPFAAHIGGDIVRSLIEPQLFTARPDGGWAPRLVEPGSVEESADLTEVSFRLRDGAAWSDGTPIGVEDLRRTADRRFVERVSVSGEVITVRLVQPMPGWRRLWSGIDSVAAPEAGVVGGPFVVSETVPGLETVLVPNDSWWGVEAGEGPWLEELRFVVVPDQTTMLQLFERGELDVVAPWAVPGLRSWICLDNPECSFAVDGGGGWQTMVLLDTESLGRDTRRSVLAGFAPEEFVGALLKGEATAVSFDGLEERPVSALGRQISLSLAEDIPMIGAMARSVQIKADDGGGVVPELRVGPSHLVAEWAAQDDFEVLVAEAYLGPSPCWSCLFGELVPGEASLADAGDPAPLMGRLATDAIARPLWIGDRLVAWRDGVEGVEANGWALFGTWNAWQWSATGG